MTDIHGTIIENFKAHIEAHGQCRMMKSPWGQKFPSVTDSDLGDWSFKRKLECNPFSLSSDHIHQQEVRSKFTLMCVPSESKISMVETFNISSVLTVDFKNECLGSFIEECCIDENPVPNVVHYVWFGKSQLNFFNFLSLMSVHRYV